MDFNGGTTINGGRVVFKDLNHTGNSTVSVNTEFDLSASTANAVTTTLSNGTISGPGNLYKTGPGVANLGTENRPETIALSAGSTIFVQAGVLKNDWGNSAWGGNLADLNIVAGAVFDIWDGAATVDALTGDGTVNKGYDGDHTLTIGVNNGGGTFSGAIYNNRTDLGYGGASGGNLIVTKVGTGTQTLSGIQTYAMLNVSNGILNLDSALGTGSSTINAGAKVNISTNQTLAALNIGDGAEITLTALAAPALSATAVPEPGSIALLLAGLLGLASRRRVAQQQS